MTQTQATDDGGGRIGRRNFVKLGIGATAAAAGIGYGGTQNARAIAPVVAAGAIGASVAVGWALREFEVVGSDGVPSGSTPAALKNEVYNTARTRKSTNASTIVDNKNILNGVEDSVYSEAKIAAIEKMNNGASESDVVAAAETAIDDYESTVISNFLKTWTESINELNSLATAVSDHPDLSLSDVFTTASDWEIQYSGDYYNPTGPNSISSTQKTYTTNNGTEITYLQPRFNYGVSGVDTTEGYDPVNGSTTNWVGSTPSTIINFSEVDELRYLQLNKWKSMFSEIETAYGNVRNNISTWVSNVYPEYQAGEIDSADLVGPRERSKMLNEEEDVPQAVADLQALNIPTETEREAEVYIPSADATVFGNLSYTGETTLSVGQYDPNETDADGNQIYPGSFYLTYDITQGSGGWSDYQESINNGILVFTSDPYQDTVYQISTTDGETVEVNTSEFTDNSDGTYSVDISGKLDTPDTSIEAISYFSEAQETQYETVLLDEPFEILGFEDEDGNEYQQIEFDQDEPQDDTNYITEEEWQDREDRYQKLIDEYEDSKNGGGAIFGDTDGGILAAAAAAGALIFVFLGGNN